MQFAIIVEEIGVTTNRRIGVVPGEPCGLNGKTTSGSGCAVPPLILFIDYVPLLEQSHSIILSV